MKFDKAVGLTILEICNKKNISIEKLSEFTKINKERFTNFDDPNFQTFTLEEFEKICFYLKFSVRDFFSHQNFIDYEI